MSTTFADTDMHQHPEDDAGAQQEPSSTTDVTTPVFPTNASATHLSYTVELYENERWFPMSGWCPKRLPSDRPHFSSKDGKRALDPIKWTLPEGYEWVGDWAIDKEHPDGTDAVGWRYGFAWGTNFHGAPSPSTFVRRRRWIRTMIRTPPAQAAAGTAPEDDASMQLVDGDRQTNNSKRNTCTAPPPPNVVSVNNESFDTCGVPSTSVPTARIKSRGTAARSTTHDNVAAVRQEAAPASTAPPPTTVATTDDPREELRQCEDERCDGEGGVASSASMRYFMERQNTSSVVSGNRRVAATTDGDDDDGIDLPAAPVAATTDAEGEGVPTGHIPDPSQVVDIADADAAFYGFAATAFTGDDGALNSDDDEAVGGDDARRRGRGFAGSETTPAEIEAYNFQKTVSEIVEDVDRSIEAEQQAADFGLVPDQPGNGGGGDTDDDDGDALFSNMLQEFVERAKSD